MSKSFFNWFRGSRGFGQSVRVRGNVWLAGCLGLMSCLWLTSIATPVWSQSPTVEPINQHLMADLREATLVAQDMGMGPMDLSQRYVAILTADGVVPNMPMTEGRAVSGAVLVGDRLIVRGDFSSLSSAFRDYGTDPVNPPNPNITSAVHIHRGEPGMNGPFQYALTVMMNPDGMGGRLMGEYTLSSEQLQALQAGNLYMDFHTTKNRAGELRGTFRALT